MINLIQALTDPSSSFKEPQDVLLNSDLNNEEKIKILLRWLSDIREISVAEDENMQGKDLAKTYESILNALHTLGAKIDLEHTPPTKQGG